MSCVNCVWENKERDLFLRHILRGEADLEDGLSMEETKSSTDVEGVKSVEQWSSERGDKQTSATDIPVFPFGFSLPFPIITSSLSLLIYTLFFLFLKKEDARY